ncbi:MAG: DUF547 domain-containing protein [Candidatus Marinimicrobia bacterium]|nr:DUF547 domain-containing protein [Candidatus Neomarinimicrobiota bacterium]
MPQKEVKHPNMDSDISDRTFNDVLNSYVDNEGRVDYNSIRENPFALQPFLDFVGSFSPQFNPELFPTNNDKKAYWINTYNGLMIQTVIENPEISSVKEIGWGYGVFWRKKYKVGGELLTLNHIEHKILRGQYNDPRIHFAINCASNSCPPIGHRIVTGINLDQQLNDKTRDFINNPANVMVDHKKRMIVLSKIFKWYKKDFESGGTTLVDYLNKYRDEPILKSSYMIIFQDYDWGLNASDTE